ncbi:flavin reductase family protein [Pisciglobus halotolerans]|uniref:NADH-FMN oxidoreductase RutF, flavin reductase (DIM6/NTAB) family n=1 Tax=Pisciglobus halotolerans TaxID=745365 RepID=A0A1I3C6U6_9LACT|nr:flavin reductase family protein [Pisciglobus halotolerans]SFH70237.1 NADH-FMN oxidoreductase RutF, flavin reductase (DIM6/NTAB) family [Pisciglobus halotolerans]
MIHFSADKLSKKQQYKFISGSVIPRPIAWITTLSKDGKVVNVAPFSFFSGASNELPLLTFAILRNNGQPKDTARNLLERQEAVVHIVDQSVVEAMNATAAPLPPEETELSRTDLTLINSQTVQVPAIKEAKIRFECRLHQYVPVQGLEGETVSDLFIVKVTDFYFDEAVFDSEKEYIQPLALLPVARLSGNQYATLEKEYTLKRPTN